jgi:hypothetical protein
VVDGMNLISEWIERKRLAQKAQENEHRPVKLVQESRHSWRVVYAD